MLPLLLGLGAQTGAQNKYGQNGLHVWVERYLWDEFCGAPKEKGDENWGAETLKLLMDRGVNPADTDHLGHTAIQAADELDAHGAARMIYQCISSMEAADLDKATPEHAAIKYARRL